MRVKDAVSRPARDVAGQTKAQTHAEMNSESDFGFS
jgi:hypothetical protein